MIRFFFVNLLAIVVAAAIGYFASRALGHDPHAREMLYAAVALLAASELALVPLLLSKGATQGPVSQAALLGTGVHMLVAMGGGFAVASAKHLLQPFIYWLCVFYWMTLIVVSVAGVKAVRLAPAEASAK